MNAKVTPIIAGDTSGSEATRLKQCVREELDNYFATLDGEQPCDLHKLVMCEVEEALIRYLMEYCQENQSRVAAYLGLNRGTLRKRLMDYSISAS
ncbi:MAG TPA: hypothetical protein DD979_03020 [Gammaproteobacteria bacterium]|nr:hypothetical protein [Gammaproteobacteria bacterium]